MSIHRTEAIVLNRRDFRETSLIVSFFTREFGRLSGILKGIRTEPAKFASNLDLFSLNEIIFYRKRNSELHLVSQCDAKNSFCKIRGSIDRINMASMMVELIYALMPPEEENTEVFNLALSALVEMETCINPEKIAAIFKIKMLDLAGFKPHLDSCVCCNNRILGQAKFSLSLGGLICEQCFKKDTAARTIFRGTVASILHIEKNDFRNNLNLGLNPQIKKELDAILNGFLNYHLGKELKTQKMLNKMNGGAQ